MNRIEEIEDYIHRFILSTKDNFERFYNDAINHRNHFTGIYKLKNGQALMDMLHEINGAFKILQGHLIPENFLTPDELFNYLKNLRLKIISFSETINDNYEYVKKIKIHSYENAETEKIFNTMVKMIDYVFDIYDISDDSLPVHRLKRSLVNEDIEGFVQIINGLLANISYLISKTKEAYLHSNIILLLKMLGFDIVAEDSTNIGRIDATVKFSRLIYIIEFKRAGEPEDAIKQIKEKKYYEKFESDQKKIIMIGMVFDNQNRRIEKYRQEVLVNIEH